MSENNVKEVIMIGAGPTSLAAAIYTTREDIETTLLEKGVIGGLAAITDWVDNYPGFTDGISGLNLAAQLEGQAERFGAKIEAVEVISLARTDDGLITLQTSDGEMKARALLIGTGSDYKRLGIPGEEEFFAKGVHFCATCDGAFYREKRLVVVGGGNSAVQESIFLTRYASHIDIIVRGDKMRASEVLQHELKNHKDKITVHFNTSPQKIVGEDNKVIGVDVLKNGQPDRIETDGVFIFIGLKPNTTFLGGSGVELDEIGLIKTNENLETAVAGIYAAGDVRSGATMQIASAVGEGATAALRIREYFDDLKRSN